MTDPLSARPTAARARSTHARTRRFTTRAARMFANLAVPCLLLAAGTPRRAFSGPVAFGPGLDLEVRQDQLPGSASSEEGWIARLSPRLTLARTGVGTYLEINGVRSFDSNRGMAGPVWVGDDAAVRFLASPSPNSNLSANAGYVSSRDPLNSVALAPLSFTESAVASGGAVRASGWLAALVAAVEPYYLPAVALPVIVLFVAVTLRWLALVWKQRGLRSQVRRDLLTPLVDLAPLARLLDSLFRCLAHRARIIPADVRRPYSMCSMYDDVPWRERSRACISARDAALP